MPSVSPRRRNPPLQSVCDEPCCLRPIFGGSASGVRFSRPHLRSFALRPGGLPPSCDGVVDGLQRLDFASRCHPSYRALAFTLAGLSPAEHASLDWTHRNPSRLSVRRSWPTAPPGPPRDRPPGRPPKRLTAWSMSCLRYWVTWFGWTWCLAAISWMVFSPARALRATLALNCGA